MNGHLLCRNFIFLGPFGVQLFSAPQARRHKGVEDFEAKF